MAGTGNRLVFDQPMIHEWGSYPAPNTQEAVADLAEYVGEYLTAMPDGEVNIGGLRREDGIVGRIGQLEDLAEVERTRVGIYVSLDEVSRFRVSLGQHINPDDIKLGYYDAAKASFPVVGSELDRHKLGNLPMLVNVADATAIPFLAFGRLRSLARPNRYLRPFAEATAREVGDIVTDPDLQGNVLMQFECLAPTLTTVRAANKSRTWGRSVAEFLAGKLAEQARMLSADQPSALHFCYGRHHGQPAVKVDLTQRGVLEPVVDLVNNTLARWPSGHRPPSIVGVPIVSESGTLPSDNGTLRDIAAQLGDLALPGETMLAAGIMTQFTEPPSVIPLARLVQHRLTRPIAVSTTCGKASYRYFIPGARRHVARQVLEWEREVVEQLRAS